MSEQKVDENEKRHPIQVVSRRSGLSQDVLRAWENRYGLVIPARSPGGRRLYSDADVDRLRLIREAAAGGRRVGKLASLSADELRAMVQEDRRESVTHVPELNGDAQATLSKTFVAESLEAVGNLDSDKLKHIVHKASHALAPTAFIDQVATQLMHKIGNLWFEGRLSPAHEHLASSVMSSILADLTAALQPGANAPRLAVATPAGQRHELGALVVTAAAQYEAWYVTYLGADLPAKDLGRASIQANASAVALSVTYPPSDPLFESELVELSRVLPEGVTLLVGGQAANSYVKTIESVGALHMTDLEHLRSTLRELAAKIPPQRPSI